MLGCRSVSFSTPRGPFPQMQFGSDFSVREWSPYAWLVSNILQYWQSGLQYGTILRNICNICAILQNIAIALHKYVLGQKCRDITSGEPRRRARQLQCATAQSNCGTRRTLARAISTRTAQTSSSFTLTPSLVSSLMAVIPNAHRSSATQTSRWITKVRIMAPARVYSLPLTVRVVKQGPSTTMTLSCLTRTMAPAQFPVCDNVAPCPCPCQVTPASSLTEVENKLFESV